MMSNIKINNLAASLKQIRNNCGDTQGTIAALLNVEVRTIVNYENGSREPDIDKLVCLANHFQVSLDRLITGK